LFFNSSTRLDVKCKDAVGEAVDHGLVAKIG
jgi:hypothetical protein